MEVTVKLVKLKVALGLPVPFKENIGYFRNGLLWVSTKCVVDNSLQNLCPVIHVGLSALWLTAAVIIGLRPTPTSYAVT